MSLQGPDFYDDPAVFANYQRRRTRTDAPNDTLEAPIIWEMVGDVTGLAVLDLGCGDAGFGRELLARGAGRYVGIEGSHSMSEVAQQTLAGTNGELVQHTIEDWQYPPQTFDLVTSRLALHYIADLAALLARIAHTLRPGGRLIFSVEHPVITSCDRGWAGDLRQDWVVDGYFEQGLRETTWLGGRVKKYHRTVEQYFSSLQAAGFTIERLSEGAPHPDSIDDPATFERRKRIPLFLILAGRKGPRDTQEAAFSEFPGPAIDGS